MIQGGWPYITAGYAITWVVILSYTGWLFWKNRN